MKLNKSYNLNLEENGEKTSNINNSNDTIQLIMTISEKQVYFEKIMERLLKNTTSRNIQRKIVLWKNDKAIVHNISNIITISVNSGKTIISTENMNVYETKYPLIYWANKLNSNLFFRCHRNYIVNINKIEEIIPWFNNTYLLKLSNNNEAYVSRKFIKQFRSLIETL